VSENGTSNDLMEAALAYAELGHPVFPCVPAGKIPLTSHGFKDATTDPARIRQWWAAAPKANIGLPTEGLLVIDVDGTENDWPGDTEKALDLTSAALATTPHGGRHYIYRQPGGKAWKSTAGRLAPKVDTRANGGYIVVPPSVVDGRAYQWIETLRLEVPRDALPEPPPWLSEALDDTGTETGPGDPNTDANAIPSGQRNATLASLAGTMRRVGMGRAEIRAALLQANADRCHPPLAAAEVEQIAASVGRYEPDGIATAVVEHHYDQDHDVLAEAEENPDPGPVPERLLSVPGFVNEVMEYTLETAPYPEPVLSFCGALTLQAFLAGRKVRDPGDNRTNLYVLGLANSGAGKNHPRQVNQRILLESGLTDCLGDTFASGEGIEDRLFVTPAVLFQTDEIDGLMAAINRRKDARHESIMNVLLKMYTSANGLYPMRVKAGKEHAVIDQPCLCIFGTAIPQHYYEALSEKMLTNGFFARMLILESGKRAKGQEARVKDLPGRVHDAARWWAACRPGANRGNLELWHPVPQVVEQTPDARHVLRDLREYADEEYAKAEDRNDGTAMAIWARANEKARRLALIHACSEDFAAPLIGKPAAQWAWDFVDHQTKRMLFMAGEHVYENDFHARCRKLVAVLRRWRERHGEDWMPFWRINRKLPWSEHEHEEVQTALRNQMLIEYVEHKTAGTPQRLYRLRSTY